LEASAGASEPGLAASGNSGSAIGIEAARSAPSFTQSSLTQREEAAGCVSGKQQQISVQSGQGMN
jgi:hypothetical protein